MTTWIRNILIVCLIGFCAYQQTDGISAKSTCNTQCKAVSKLIDIQERNAQQLQLQHDWTDALSSFEISARNSESRLRSRRTNSTSSIGSRIFSQHQHLYAAHHGQELHSSHQLNAIVVLSGLVQLSLPTEQIPFPFHSFW